MGTFVLRWGVFAVVTTAAGAMITATRLSQRTMHYDSLQQLLMASIEIGSVAVPAVIAVDFIAGATKSVLHLKRGSQRNALKTLATSAAVDTLLLAYSFAVLLAVLRFAG